jgi:uncharacterized protein (TIGR00369 family)
VIDDSEIWLVPPYGADSDKWAEWAEGMPVSRRMGLRCDKIEAGRATLVVEESIWPLNPNGAMHGGLVAAIADHCFGVVATTVLDEERMPATATLTADFLRPALPPLTFEASIDRVGRTMAFVTVEVINRAGKIATKVNGTMVIDGSSRFAPADAG